MSAAALAPRNLTRVTTAVTDDAILHAACARAGLDSSSAAPLHRHATSVWLLRDLDVVVRIDHSGNQGRADRAVTVTRWLVSQDFLATEPIDVDQPVDVDSTPVTFWRHYPQDGRPAPGAGALGALLRQLHVLPKPPVTLDDYEPLTHLGNALQADLPLPDDDRTWLAERRLQLLDAYDLLDSSLGVGFVHGDAYPGNTLWDGRLVRLGDWDEIARGPRELDLVNTHQGARFGRSAAERQAFTDAYGWDVTAWPGFPVLRDMRDLHTLGAFLERAAHGDQGAIAELRHRVDILRVGSSEVQWHSI
jgi:hypothetical protein